MEFIESPEGIFFNPRSVNKNLVTPVIQSNLNPPKPVVKVGPTSKFSFAGFGKSITANPPSQAATVVVESSNVYPSLPIISDSILDHVIFVGRKVVYGNNKKPRLDESTRKIVNWGDLMATHESKSEEQQERDRKREEAREAELKDAQSQTMDLFVGMDTDYIVEEPVTDLLAIKISDLIKGMDQYDVVGKKDKTIGNTTLASDFFRMLYDSFEYLNPEERGKLLITIIFGGLISRSKLSGIGGKSVVTKFKDIASNLSKLTKGGQNSNVDRVYTRISEIICSQKLNRYRADVTAMDQVTNVINLINKLVTTKKTVYFPTNFLFSDPVSVSTTVNGKVTITVKSVALTGVPIVENLNDFFAENKPVVKKTTGKKSHDDDDNNAIDQEDKMSNAAHSSKNDRYGF